jgi:Putative zincin peptidase
MFFIPGFVIALVTFPGVIVHEAAHRFFCDLAGVPVYKVCYFQVGNPSGYVIHGPTNSLRASFLITVGPLIVNTLLCAIIGLPLAILLPLNVDDVPGVFILLGWLGISIGMHAFPSPQDAANFSAAVRASGRGLLCVVARVFQGLVGLAHLLRFFWFDLIYAVGVATVPALIVLGVAQ